MRCFAWAHNNYVSIFQVKSSSSLNLSGQLQGRTSQQHSVLTQATHRYSTNTAYHKMGRLIGIAPKDGTSQQHTVSMCLHKQHISTLTQPKSRQNMGHLSSILCSHKQPITRCGSCQGKQEPSKECPTDVPYSTLNGVGPTIKSQHPFFTDD